MPVSGLQPDGLPHSDTDGSLPVCGSPSFFAAYHVLPRLRKPRHPPSALLLFPRSRVLHSEIAVPNLSFRHDSSSRLYDYRLSFLLYLVIFPSIVNELAGSRPGRRYSAKTESQLSSLSLIFSKETSLYLPKPPFGLQKGGVPATPSGTATLLRLSPSYRFCPRPFLPVADFRHPRLPWLDGRCVQGPGTYSPRHG